jgi:hypothetical protein
MRVTFENGIAGKVCPGCHLWKPLSEYYFDATKGESQGFTPCHCKSCRAEAGKQQRLRFRLMRERAVELGIWEPIEARAELEARRRLGIPDERLRL